MFLYLLLSLYFTLTSFALAGRRSRTCVDVVWNVFDFNITLAACPGRRLLWHSLKGRQRSRDRTGPTKHHEMTCLKLFWSDPNERLFCFFTTASDPNLIYKRSEFNEINKNNYGCLIQKGINKLLAFDRGLCASRFYRPYFTCVVGGENQWCAP